MDKNKKEGGQKKYVRKIYDDEFYQISAVLLSNKFLNLERLFLDRYRMIGLRIPETGFENENEYRKWLKSAMNLRPSPGELVRDILNKFKLDPDNECFRNYLVNRLFHKKMPWNECKNERSTIRLMTRNNSQPRGLWVEITPWTKKQDYDNLWETIKDLRRTLIGYREKEKFQNTFERDFKIYELYLDIKNNHLDKRIGQEKIVGLMQDDVRYKEILKKFNHGDIQNKIRHITSHFNRLLTNIDIL